MSLSKFKEKPLATYCGPGITSKKDIRVNFFGAEPGTGVVFLFPVEGAEDDLSEAESAGGAFVKDGMLHLPARSENVVNTLRNVVIGKGKHRICIVEHVLCAVALCGLNDLYIEVDGPELPLGNGSSDFWMEVLADAGLKKSLPEADLELSVPLSVERPGRSLLAVPAEKFSVTYLMDWNHPKIGRTWRSWEPSEEPEAITSARTFGSLAEHKMLGLDKDVVSLTEDDFTMPLRFADEPVRHKLLDLIGDLMLAGVNPLRVKARFISIKGGHEMDVEMARKLSAALS